MTLQFPDTALADLANSLAPAVEHATRAMREFAEVVVPVLRSVSGWSTQAVVALAPESVPEEALREHARRLNLRRQWRKHNWRRINRRQRAEAYWTWLAER